MGSPWADQDATRGKQARAIANDARILQAAGAIAARDGWLGLSPFRVASASGLSRTAVQNRYQDNVEIAVAVWRDFAALPVTSVLKATLDHGGLLDDEPSVDGLTTAFETLVSDSQPLRAGAELLVLAHFEPSLAAGVDETLGQVVREWLPVQSDSAPIGQRGYLLCSALGLLLTSRRSGAGSLDWRPVAGKLVDGLRERLDPMVIPRDRAPHLGHDLDFGTGDVPLERLLNATLRIVGERGFDGATTREIVREAGCTEGLLFGRYESKLALFLDATRRQAALTLHANEVHMASLAARFDPAIATAVTMREWQHPDLARDRALMLEQWRLGWHLPEVAQAQEAEIAALLEALLVSDPTHYARDAALAHLAHANGLGVGLLPLLAPDCWQLPYINATIPMTARGL